jgi:hypothetical protein
MKMEIAVVTSADVVAEGSLFVALFASGVLVSS